MTTPSKNDYTEHPPKQKSTSKSGNALARKALGERMERIALARELGISIDELEAF